MKDEPGAIEPQPARDEWVRVNPDQPACQKLHLCQYLAELPELGEEEPAKDQHKWFPAQYEPGHAVSECCTGFLIK
ncbi:MAG TPA: hypothetical protein VKF36_14620 [Syntrophorhabdales bacterium]|nr:hypothetical protein [Syntrophorhabdales bacterium]